MKNNVNFIKKLRFTIKYLLCVVICVVFSGCSGKDRAGSEDVKVENIKIETDKEVEEVKEEAVEQEEIEEIPDAAELPYSDVCDEDYLKKCIFLGDSRMVGMSQMGYIPQQNTLAQIGLCHTNAMNTRYKTYEGMDYSFKSYLQSHQASVIYICYGINGIKSIPEENYEKAFTNIVETVKELEPNSAIVISSIWPVNDQGQYKSTVSTELVKKYNEFLHELALEQEVYFIDLCKELELEDGSINPLYDSGDGLHYKQAGYDVVVDYIMHHPVPELYEEDGYNFFKKESFIWKNPVKPKVENAESGNSAETGAEAGDAQANPEEQYNPEGQEYYEDNPEGEGYSGDEQSPEVVPDINIENPEENNDVQPDGGEQPVEIPEETGGSEGAGDENIVL